MDYYLACLLHKTPVPYERVLECCDTVLGIDAANVKAMYRKGQAKYETKDYEAALELFNEALNYEAGQTGIDCSEVRNWGFQS